MVGKDNDREVAAGQLTTPPSSGMVTPAILVCLRMTCTPHTAKSKEVIFQMMASVMTARDENRSNKHVSATYATSATNVKLAYSELNA